VACGSGGVHAAGTTNTDIAVPRSTRSVVDPKIAWATPDMPCAPMTITSADSRSAIWQMTSAALPVTTRRSASSGEATAVRTKRSSSWCVSAARSTPAVLAASASSGSCACSTTSWAPHWAANRLAAFSATREQSEKSTAARMRRGGNMLVLSSAP
jgi:hypothetical protein